MTSHPLKYAHLDFRTQLHLWKAGRFEPDHLFSLGRPSDALRRAGLDDASVTMTQGMLRQITDLNGLDTEGLVGLAAAILDPVLAFDSMTRLGAKVLLTELTGEEPHPAVVIDLGRTLRGPTVLDVRAICPSDALSLELWIELGLACYAHPERSGPWLRRILLSDIDRLVARLARIAVDPLSPTPSLI
jgi:hypothetical protein